jgi:Domain of unknown function (DUF6468)
MSYGFPFIIEATVAVLLVFTIIYCIRLNTGIMQLKGNEKTLKATIAELLLATESAERAIAGLKTTVREADQTLGERLRGAEKFSIEIGRQLEAGETVLNKVAQIAAIRRTDSGLVKPETKDPKAILASAQAFAERSRRKDRAA